MKRRQNTSQGTKKQFTRLLPLAGLVAAMLTFTGASPIGKRPIGVGLTPILGNYPATTILLSTNTTVTPNTAPTEAASMNVSTSIDFNGALEGDPTTGVVRVTDAHPAGTYTVTVRAFSSTGEQSSTTFTLSVTTPETCLPVSFAPAAHYSTVDQSPTSIAVGDFDGDGKQDLAMSSFATANASYLSILLGDGAGHFSRDNMQPPPGIGGSYSVAVGDFNGDGRQDLVTTNINASNVSVLLGDGSGHFGARTNFSTGSFPWQVAVGDFNGDGKPDVATANRSGTVSILLGDGAGHFADPMNFGAGTDSHHMAVGDFNGDGKEDLAVSNYGSHNVSILLGDGTGHFGAAVNLAVGNSPEAVVVGDFNNDGKQDLAVANPNSHDVSILLGDGAGHFDIMNLPVGNENNVPSSVTVGDFNGDDKQDLAVSDYLGFVSIFVGDGMGHFDSATNLNFGGYFVTVGDFDGDGKQDLAAPHSYDVSIFLRVCLCSDCPEPTLGNYPATTIALSSDTVVTPDAAPTTTTNIHVSTSTNFNGRLEGNPATGVVRVTDAHPAGTYTLTVKAFNVLDSNGASASTTFTLTVTTPETCDSVSFAAAVNVDAGPSPSSMLVGDFNRDGKQDLAMTRSVLLGDGAGHFSAVTTPFGPSSFAISVAVGDFNGDGNQDLTAISSNGPQVSVVLGDGTGHFSDPTIFPSGGYPHPAVAVGDFNEDGKQDLVLARYAESPAVSIMLGDGAGNFFSHGAFATSGFVYSVAVGDFNGDGKQDLATANQFVGSVSILLGDGAGNFSITPNSPFGAGSFPLSVAVGDFNGDGNQDLAVANRGSANVSILLGDGASNFSGPIDFGVAGAPYSVAVGDFNGDGKQDLATANVSSDNVSILLGDGAGNFSGSINFAVGHGPNSVVVGDFNSDGKQDLATANSSNVSILLNNCTSNDCTVCHKHTTTITLPCNSMEYRRHLDHGDSVGACPSGGGRKD